MARDWQAVSVGKRVITCVYRMHTYGDPHLKCTRTRLRLAPLLKDLPFLLPRRAAELVCCKGPRKGLGTCAGATNVTGSPAFVAAWCKRKVHRRSISIFFFAGYI